MLNTSERQGASSFWDKRFAHRTNIILVNGDLRFSIEPSYHFWRVALHSPNLKCGTSCFWKHMENLCFLKRYGLCIDWKNIDYDWNKTSIPFGLCHWSAKQFQCQASFLSTPRFLHLSILQGRLTLSSVVQFLNQEKPKAKPFLERGHAIKIKRLPIFWKLYPPPRKPADQVIHW